MRFTNRIIGSTRGQASAMALLLLVGGSLRAIADPLDLASSKNSAQQAGDTSETFRSPEGEHRDRLEDLAYRYMYQEVDADGADAIMNAIRALSATEAKRFHEALVSLQLGNTSALKENSDATLAGELLDRAAMRQISFLDLPPSEVESFIQDAVAPEPDEPLECVSCVKVSSCFCKSACLGWTCPKPYPCLYFAAAGNDRQSTDACEPGACDHRIWYTSVNRWMPDLHPRTSAARCVIQFYGGCLASRWNVSRQELVVGAGSTVACFIFSDPGGYLRQNINVYDDDH